MKFDILPFKGIAIALVFFGTAGMTIAGETTVTLENGVVGTLNMPDAGSGAAVLMLHGFGSSRDEVGGMYANTAAGLADQGIASFRIDFRGYGQSAGDTGASTIDLQVEDALLATDYLQGLDGIDGDRLGVLGFSLGGGIAALASQARPDGFKSMVTWSSVGDLEKDFRASLGDETFAMAAEKGVVGFDLGWRTMVLKQGFFDSLAANDVAAAIAGYKGAFLAIAGSEDFSAAYAPGFAESVAGTPSEAWIVEGGDHIYQVFGDPAMSQSVISKTVEWFRNTL